MNTTITLPRATVEQALEALEAMQSYAAAERKGLRICDEAITALRAALAEPVQEPVAWRCGYRSVTTGEMDWRGYAAHPNLRSPEIIMEPLYTAPPQRKPLTEEEIDRVTIKCFGPNADLGFHRYHGRAIERAHGITGPEDKGG